MAGLTTGRTAALPPSGGLNFPCHIAGDRAMRVHRNNTAEWQHYYNWERPHSAHNGKTPMERYFELAEKTPYSDAVHANYQPNEEHIQEQNYKLELGLRKLKRCL